MDRDPQRWPFSSVFSFPSSFTSDIICHVAAMSHDCLNTQRSAVTFFSEMMIFDALTSLLGWLCGLPSVLYSKALWRRDGQYLQGLCRRAWDGVWSSRLLSATIYVNLPLATNKPSVGYVVPCLARLGVYQPSN